MDHSHMNHSQMDRSQMDHSKMDHSHMDHSHMDHSQASSSQPGDSHHSDPHMMMMKMYFHFGFENQFFFGHLNIDSTFKLWATCVVLFALGILFEAIKYVRCVRCGCTVSNRKPGSESGPANVRLESLGSSKPDKRVADHTCFVGKLRSTRHKSIQTLLHTIQTVVGFVLMLAVMYFNLCIIFAVVAGAAVGHYVFYRSYNEIEALDSCH